MISLTRRDVKFSNLSRTSITDILANMVILALINERKRATPPEQAYISRLMIQQCSNYDQMTILASLVINIALSLLV